MTRRPEAAEGWFVPPRPRVLAHRGLAVDAPENTLLAFLRALSAGVTYLETDVHASSDGVAVVSHDPDLRRVAERDVRVDELTMAELREVPLGEGQGYCSLEELLDAFPQARINLDLKSDAAVAPAVAAIAAAGAADRVLVTSFSGRRRRRATRALPGVATSASSVAAAFAMAAARLGLVPVAAAILRRVDALQIPPRYGPFSTSTPRVIRRLHRAGVEVHYWTVDDPAELRRLVSDGADGVVCDRADLAVEVLRDAGLLTV